jgi:hypothetical protein
MPTAAKFETQARLRREEAERDAKMAAQKANRLAAEAKSKDALEQHAKRVAALYKSMREFEAHAEEKAGFELKKAAEKRAALDQALVKARELCTAAGEDFKTFQEKYAPNYKRTRLYQVLAIADGRKTVEGVREEERERKRRQRAGKVSGTSDNVPDKMAEVAPAADIAALRARAKALGYSLHRKGTEFRLTSKDGLVSGTNSLDGVIELLDEFEGKIPRAVADAVRRADPRHEQRRGREGIPSTECRAGRSPGGPRRTRR